MDDIFTVCSRLYALQQLPLSLVDREGRYIQSWPELLKSAVRPEMMHLVVEDFCLQKRDAQHPLISFIFNGYFVGAIVLDHERYLVIGLCSPYRHSRQELMELCADTVLPELMQPYCDLMLQSPVITLPQMKAYMALLTQLLSGVMIPEDHILFSDNAGQPTASGKSFSDAQFQQREAADEHAKLDYETAVCQAITLGRADLLTRALYAPPGGSIGVMSSNELRQLRYTFISFATLVSRAAIEGGLPEESAFLLSDLYCQRMDALSERSDIERLLGGMAMDFCDKVAKGHLSVETSPAIRKALSYISLHLHEDFGMEDLAEHCSLSRRSLSQRFKEELGLSVVDYVQQEKIGEARFLLEHTDLPLPQITMLLNYSSQSYFTVQFKKLVGETPERYRTRLQGR